MNTTASRLIRWCGLAAIVAGILFVVIQPIHPPDTLASVTTGAWAAVHYLTIATFVLFLIGISGIYARQVEKVGWLGLAGFLMLGLEMIIILAYTSVEAFVLPLVATEAPSFTHGFLGIFAGHASEVGLGVLPSLWLVSGALILLGCLSLGIATLRAGILPRWAAVVFAFGGPASAILVSVLPHELERIAAAPIGIGLAWLGYGLWSERRERALEPLPGGATPQPALTGA
jgi:hypothetical protein